MTNPASKRLIKTGADLSQEDLSVSRWPLARQPHLLETSLPGVFAVGDARGCGQIAETWAAKTIKNMVRGLQDLTAMIVSSS